MPVARYPASTPTMCRVVDVIADLFWKHVDRRSREECWPWTGTVTKAGYGEIRRRTDKVRVYAHRYSLSVATGTDLPSTALVLHSCDNPRCVNPAHLRVGTHRDNSEDRTERNRNASGDRSGARLHPERCARGERIATSKLTSSDVLEIRSRHDHGESFRSIGRAFKVSPINVRNIVQRKTWAHVA